MPHVRHDGITQSHKYTLHDECVCWLGHASEHVCVALKAPCVIVQWKVCILAAKISVARLSYNLVAC